MKITELSITPIKTARTTGVYSRHLILKLVTDEGIIGYGEVADIGDYRTTAAGNDEILAWINPGPQGDMAYTRLYIAQSRKFAFGFTGFKGARDDNQVSGQILFAGNFINRAPRYSRILHGITS